MSAARAAHAAYARAARRMRGGPGAEAEALLRAAHLLDRARRDPRQLPAALRFNLRLWAIFAADLADPRSPLSGPLRARLRDLCAFMDDAIDEAARHPRRARLDAMIAVNRTLAARPGSDHGQ